MNPPHSRDPWSRLATAAREVRDERDATAPYGFATRVAALAFAQEPRVVSIFERLALRAVGVATLLALGSVAWNYQVVNLPPAGPAVAVETEAISPTDDAVAIVLAIAD